MFTKHSLSGEESILDDEPSVLRTTFLISLPWPVDSPRGNASSQASQKMSKKLKSGQTGHHVQRKDATESALAEQRQAFKRKFGQEPGPDDPVFFDPNSATPKHLPEEEGRRKILMAMERAGIDPAIIYAFKRTGVIVTEGTYYMIPHESLRAYEAAIEEFGRIC